MQTFLQDFQKQIKGIWARLDGGQRLVVSAVLLATVVGFSSIVWYASQPSYEVVRTAQSPEEVGQIRQALEQASISYETDATGRSFSVERSKFGLANMALAEAGVDGNSASALGSSIIDDAETKAFKLNNAQIAIAQSAILKLDGVAAVTVTASSPKRRSAFRDRDAEQRPSATVALRLRPGVVFEALAHSAASLAASQLMVPMQNIEVFNAANAQRYRYDPDRDAGAGTGEFFAMQEKMGRDRTELAQGLLDRLWPGRASVAVTVELDPAWEVRSERVTPTERLLRSEKTSKDVTESSKPEAGTAEATASPSNSKKNETKDREYVTDIGERRTGRLAPEVKRLSVAVLYDRSLTKAEGFKPEELGSAVKAIVGWDATRDQADAFSMLAAEFAPLPEIPAVADESGFMDLATRWGPTAGQLLSVLVVLLFLRGMFRRTGSKSAPQAEPPAEPETLSAQEQQKRMRKEIERSIASDPAALAKMMESWLMEQKV